MPPSRPLENLTLGELIAARADELGDKVCVTISEESITYGDLHRRSNAYAAALSCLGLQHGDRIATLMGNCAEAAYSWFGAAKVGAIEVAINPAYKGEFLRHQMGKCEAKVLVIDEENIPNLAAVIADLPALRTVIVRGESASAADALAGVSVVGTAQLLEYGADFIATGREPRWSDPSSIQYTGGTTGPSKGAIVTHRQLIRIANDMSQAAERTADDIMYSSMPLFHLNAKVVTVLGPIIAKGSGVLDAKFSVSRTWDRVRETGATGISILGSMVMMLWNLPHDPRDRELPINCIIGVPIPPELHRAIEERYACRLLVLYGMSETGPVTMADLRREAVPGSSGRVCADSYEVAIVDDNDEFLPNGVSGEVVCRPRRPGICFSGYYKEPDATLEAFRNLWFHTGDLGRFDDDGNFYFVDRKADFMRRRGENISSADVEQALLRHPHVRDVAAHAVPSPFTEDDIKVCVVVDPEAVVSHEVLYAFCQETLPKFAVPRYIEFMDEIPQGPSHKPMKGALRARGVTVSTWDAESLGHGRSSGGSS